MDNVLLAPHLGYVSRDNYEVLLGDAFENIVAYSKGKPTGVVTAGGNEAPDSLLPRLRQKPGGK